MQKGRSFRPQGLLARGGACPVGRSLPGGGGALTQPAGQSWGLSGRRSLLKGWGLSEGAWPAHLLALLVPFLLFPSLLLLLLFLRPLLGLLFARRLPLALGGGVEGVSPGGWGTPGAGHPKRPGEPQERPYGPRGRHGETAGWGHTPQRAGELQERPQKPRGPQEKPGETQRPQWRPYEPQGTPRETP